MFELELDDSVCHFHPFSLCDVNTANCRAKKTIITKETIKHVFECGSEKVVVKQSGIFAGNYASAFALLPPVPKLSCISRLCSKMHIEPMGETASAETFESLARKLSLKNEVVASVWIAPLMALRKEVFGVSSAIFSMKMRVEGYGPNERYVDRLLKGLEYVKKNAFVVTDKEAWRVATMPYASLYLHFEKYLTFEVEGNAPREKFFENREIKKKDDVIIIEWDNDKPLWYLIGSLGIRKPKAETPEEMLYELLTRRNSSSVRVNLGRNVPISAKVFFGDVLLGTWFTQKPVPVGSRDFLTIVGPRAELLFQPCEGEVRAVCNGVERPAEVEDFEVFFGDCHKGVVKVGDCEAPFWQFLSAFYSSRADTA